MKTVIVTNRDKSATGAGEGDKPILDALWRLESLGGLTAGEKFKLVNVFGDSRSDAESVTRMESELPGLKFTVSKSNG